MAIHMKFHLSNSANKCRKFVLQEKAIFKT
jgi:hypothetical protein